MDCAAINQSATYSAHQYVQVTQQRCSLFFSLRPEAQFSSAIKGFRRKLQTSDCLYN